jgi:hypothetical protein
MLLLFLGTTALLEIGNTLSNIENCFDALQSSGYWVCHDDLIFTVTAMERGLRRKLRAIRPKLSLLFRR